jgi:hypothetical protein
MILIALLFATPFANPLNAIHHVLNPKMPFVMSNAKNQNAKLNALIKVAKCLTVPNVSPYANNLIVSLIAKHPNLNVNQSAKNLNVTGNATNPPALNPSVNLFAKTPTVSLKLTVVLVQWELLKSLNLSPFSRKQNQTKAVVDVVRSLYK